MIAAPVFLLAGLPGKMLAAPLLTVSIGAPGKTQKTVYLSVTWTWQRS
jgi:hypothetical protein